ncbi:MAG TPA: hypothetical protein PKW35_05710 [Nannocystaceae bacterium]|nr:hypothetical protein [Nannocystaceae bacterium]
MPTAPRFRVALSFPGGKYRHFVEQVAHSLALYLGKERVLYDRFHSEEFADLDLDAALPAHYARNAELVAVFVCEEYEKKPWCGIEYRQIRRHVFRGEGRRVMPIRLDSTTVTLPGEDAAGYLDIDTSGGKPAQVATRILKRHGVSADEQLELFLDQVFHMEEIRQFVRRDAPEAADGVRCGGDAVKILRASGAIRIDLFDTLRANVAAAVDECPRLKELAIDFVAEIDAIQERQDLRPVDLRRTTGGDTPPETSNDDLAHAGVRPSHFGLVLDRTKQWEKFTSRCLRPVGDWIFVVHGRHDQDLHLFLDRIRRFHDDMEDGVGHNRHALVIVDLDQGSRPASASAWVGRVRQEIAAHLRRQVPDDLAGALGELCGAGPALLVLAGQGGGGLTAVRRRGIEPLKISERKGLFDFMGVLAATLAATASSRKHPLRVVVPVEYAERPKDPLMIGLQSHLKPPFEVLAELTYPEWSEVEESVDDYMMKRLGHPSEAIRALCKGTYDELAKDPARRHFAALGEVLSAILGEHIEPQP